MSTSHLRLIATVAAIAAAALTGVVTGLLAGDSSSMFEVTVAAVGFIGACVAGLIVVAVLSSRMSSPPATPVAVGPDDNALAAIDQLRAERRILVDTCIYVRDRATSQAIADKLGSGLTEAGIATLAPTGEHFDPTRHEAGGTTAAPDPSQDGIIAVVETVGYADRTAIVRNPIVTVYRNGGPR